MEIVDLEQAIRKAIYIYYNKPEEVVLSDEQFDLMMRELKERAPDSPIHNEVGVTSIEGKVWHYKKMYSLDNAMNEQEAQKFCAKAGFVDCVVSQKMDGAGVELIYWDGRLHMATTRGDGLWGDEIPHIIHIVPKQLNGDPEKIAAVYGEVVISGPAFEELGNGYSSPRNLAAGSLMTKDNPMVLKERGAQFLAHDISGPEDYGAKLARLEDLGFTTIPYTITKGWSGIHEAYSTLYELRDKFYEEYGPSDGVVVRIDSREVSELFGWGDKAPKFAIAWKFPHEEKTVIVKNVRWDVSKNGRLTPVAEFDGVEIDGATITNCTLSNASIVRDKRVGVGCTMVIIRSGGVIPKFIRRLSEGYSMDLNKIECPSCGSIGVWDDNKTFLHCPNDACPAQAADFIVEFLDRLEYKGLGDKSAQKLVEAGCKTPADVCSMEVGFIIDVLGFSKIHAIEVHQDLQNLKQVPYERFLHALNIDMLGKRYSKQFAGQVTPTQFKMLVEIWLGERSNPLRPGHIFDQVFGGVTGQRMFESFLNKVDFIHDLYDIGFEVKERKMNNVEALRFVITGTLSKPRKEYEQLIEKTGHNFSNSLTKETEYLVIGENTGRNKIEKAKKFGTKIITEQGLMNLLEGKE